MRFIYWKWLCLRFLSGSGFWVLKGILLNSLYISRSKNAPVVPVSTNILNFSAEKPALECGNRYPDCWSCFIDVHTRLWVHRVSNADPYQPGSCHKNGRNHWLSIQFLSARFPGERGLCATLGSGLAFCRHDIGVRSCLLPIGAQQTSRPHSPQSPTAASPAWPPHRTAALPRARLRPRRACARRPPAPPPGTPALC